jgi:hypothetical protein
MFISGQCHCGNIRFQLRWLPEPDHIPARACTCAFCVKHGGAWTACPTGELIVSVRDNTLRSRYAFGTNTADFHVCSRCGVVPVVTSVIDGTTYAVVNVNTFEVVDVSLVKKASVSFDEEDEPSRLARRRRNWIGRVAFMDGGI